MGRCDLVAPHTMLLASAHWSSLSRSFCWAFLPFSKSTLPPGLGSSVNLPRVHSITLSRLSIKILNGTGPWALGNTTVDGPPAGCKSIHHHSLSSAIQSVLPSKQCTHPSHQHPVPPRECLISLRKGKSKINESTFNKTNKILMYTEIYSRKWN